MDVKSSLIEYGLDEKEISVYLFLLQNGINSANGISVGTGILRQTVYDTVSKLENKGLVSEVIKNDKKYFIAQDPEAFISILKDKEIIVKNVMSELKSIKNISLDKTSTKQFNGLKGIKLIYEDFLKSKTEIKTIQQDIPEKLLKEYFIENFSIKRVEKKIQIKILKSGIETEFQKLINTDKKKFREVKLISSLDGVDSHIVLYNGKIAFLDYRDEPSGIVIENEVFSKSFEIIFNILWKMGKKY